MTSLAPISANLKIGPKDEVAHEELEEVAHEELEEVTHEELEEDELEQEDELEKEIGAGAAGVASSFLDFFSVPLSVPLDGQSPSVFLLLASI